VIHLSQYLDETESALVMARQAAADTAGDS
jgi:hypothetical protein